MNKKQILIITGPTGVGKTDLVLKLGSSLPCEIINIDIGQFYKPFAIGTAKPDWKNEPVPHHLFDILDTPKSFTVHEYRDIVLKTINEVWAKNKLPILVGGSGFYIQSLLFPLPVTVNSQHPAREDFFDLKSDNLWQLLYDIDPVRAQVIEKKDEYRIKRALEIWKKTGIKPSEHVAVFNPPCDFTFIVVDRDRDELYQRINQRVIQMLDQGWIDEVKKIKNSEWQDFLKIKKLIGYDDIIKYLDSECKDMDVLIDTIQQKTRKYAKRQLTFFRMLSSKILINSLNSTSSHILPCPAKPCAKPGSEDGNPSRRIKIIWTNLTLLTDINTLFESLK